MIFEVSPSQIEELDQTDLVLLLRRLLHAEAQKAGIDLRGVSVPLQINVADGGEDARISWQGGEQRTDYIPCRFTVFQSKASSLRPAGWMKETWTKGSQKTGRTRVLNSALKKAIAEKGAYLGFTSSALVGNKPDEAVQAIRLGIKETGADPTLLKAIEIYDANKIAAWCSTHPSVSVWLNEHKSGLSLGGFQTVEGFGKQADFSTIQHVADNTKRYVVNDVSLGATDSGRGQSGNVLTFEQARERLSDHLMQPKNIVRLVGPSGIGKTRFCYELLKDISTVTKESRSVSAIVCDFRNVGTTVFQIAQRLAEQGSPTLIIVDECSREAAQQLAGIVLADGSLLRLLTIDLDDRPIQIDNCLNISLNPSDTALVEGIIRQRLPKATPSEISYISNLCGGFPKIAVLATESYVKSAPVLKSIEDVVERILTGAGITEDAQVRAIEGLSLFESLGADDDLSEQFDLVAERLSALSGDLMFEHLSRAASHHLVERRGRFFVTQPLPIASFLGARRLSRLRVKSILSFLEYATPLTQKSFFAQWRYFDHSRTALEVTERLFSLNGAFGSLESWKTKHGSECVNALVHVDPNTVGDAVRRLLGDLSLDELADLGAGRRHIVWALEKLVFRNETFDIAARLLMRLGARETEKYSNNATGLFKQLFHVQLSGTEVAPPMRFIVLDEGLASNDPQTIALCIEALDETLSRSGFTRSVGSEQIGTRPPLSDWSAKTWGDVFDFHRQGLQRLMALRKSKPEFARRCELTIARHLRGLIFENLLPDIENVAKLIAGERGLWLDALESIGDWLYYDRTGAPEALAIRVRALYDSLFPTDEVERALLYTKFWSADIHDPDQVYDREDASTKDFEYATTKAVELAEQIAKNPATTERAIRTMAAEELHTGFPFSRALALHVPDPVSSFQLTVDTFDKSDGAGLQFLRGFLSGADARSGAVGDVCINIALASDLLKKQAINVYTSVGITPARLEDVRRSLKEGTLRPRDCSYLSYGRGMDTLDPNTFTPLLDDLSSEHGAEGAWTALEIISMYQHGRATLNTSLKDRVKVIVTSPKLVEKIERGTRDGHLFESSIELLVRHDGVDDAVLAGVGDQIARLCRSSDTDAIFTLDGPIRKALRKLLAFKSSALWLSISRFYEFATDTERFWLKHLVGPSDHQFDGESHNLEGVLFDVPKDDLIAWARVDPVRRVEFLCEFYPVLEQDAENAPRWHPALQSLADEFGGISEFRDSLAHRLYPRSWSGSIIPHFEVYLEPLKKWFEHPISQLAIWAREQHRIIERRIAEERKSEIED